MPKTMTELDIAKVEITMGRFDFEEMHEIMKKMRWSWATSSSPGGLPTVEELKGAAENLLKETFGEANPIAVISTGGFRASYDI